MMLFVLLLLQGEPTTLDGWIAKGRERYVNGFTTESVSAWTKAIELNKDRAESYVGRARAKRQGNDAAGAIEDINKALQLAPDNPLYYVERGLAWSRRGNPSNEKDDYEKALSLDPENTAALYSRGQLRRRQNKHKEAEEDLKKAGEASSEEKSLLWRAYAKMALGNLVAQDDKSDGPEAAVPGSLTGATIEWVKGALEDFNTVLEKDPKNGLLLAERASVLISLGKFDEAERDLRQSIELAPKQPKTHFELGRRMEYVGKYKEALACFSKAVELDSRYGSAYFGRANAKAALGDVKGAIADHTKVLELNGKWTSAYFNRANCKMKIQEWNGAISDFNKVIQLDDGKLVMAALCNRAYIKKQTADEAGSKKDYAKAAGMEAETAWQLEYRSMAKENTGDLKGALTDLQAAYEKSADGSAQRAGIEKNIERLKKK